MMNIWQDENVEHRMRKIQGLWPEFDDGFALLLAHVFCKKEVRYNAAQSRETFAVVKIYR